MAKNIEIKARVKDMDELTRNVETLCGDAGTLLRQRDVFYRCRSFRVKLREVNGSSELIIYQRANTSGPKGSRYLRLPVRFPETVHKLLSFLLGVRGVVEKTRVLHMAGQTRIHLDTVRDLGTFMEFEVVLGPEDSHERGVAIADDLMLKLGVRQQDLIDCAYMDLLEQR